MNEIDLTQQDYLEISQQLQDNLYSNAKYLKELSSDSLEEIQLKATLMYDCDLAYVAELARQL